MLAYIYFDQLIHWPAGVGERDGGREKKKRAQLARESGKEELKGGPHPIDQNLEGGTTTRLCPSIHCSSYPRGPQPTIGEQKKRPIYKGSSRPVKKQEQKKRARTKSKLAS